MASQKPANFVALNAIAPQDTGTLMIKSAKTFIITTIIGIGTLPAASFAHQRFITQPSTIYSVESDPNQQLVTEILLYAQDNGRFPAMTSLKATLALLQPYLQGRKLSPITARLNASLSGKPFQDSAEATPLVVMYAHLPGKQTMYKVYFTNGSTRILSSTAFMRLKKVQHIK